VSFGRNIKFNKGIFMLTLDTELAWGMVDKPLSLISNKEYFCNTRSAIDGMLELLEKYQISATWAIVGSLLLDKPNFEDEFIEDIVADSTKEVKNEYINLLKQEDIWCGKDILQKIKSCLVPQEIGSHSFSNVIFRDVRVTKDIAVKEFRQGKDILYQHGEEPISFIFPRNEINYLK